MKQYYFLTSQSWLMQACKEMRRAYDLNLFSPFLAYKEIYLVNDSRVCSVNSGEIRFTGPSLSSARFFCGVWVGGSLPPTNYLSCSLFRTHPLSFFSHWICICLQFLVFHIHKVLPYVKHFKLPQLLVCLVVSDCAESKCILSRQKDKYLETRTQRLRVKEERLGHHLTVVVLQGIFRAVEIIKALNLHCRLLTDFS